MAARFALGALQLDCSQQMPQRVGRTFAAIERACMVDAYTSGGFLEKIQFCNAIVSSMPYPAQRDAEARAFATMIYDALHSGRTWWTTPSAGPTHLLPFSEACVGLAVLLLLPTPATTAQTLHDAALELYKILTAHRWRNSREEHPRTRSGGVLESELTHLLVCVLTVEALVFNNALLQGNSSGDGTPPPIEALARAMSRDMMSSCSGSYLPLDAFLYWMQQLPERLHPELFATASSRSPAAAGPGAAASTPAQAEDADDTAARAEQEQRRRQAAYDARAAAEREQLRAPQQQDADRERVRRFRDERSARDRERADAADRGAATTATSAAATAASSVWWDYRTARGVMYWSNGFDESVWSMPKNVWIRTVDEASGRAYRYHSSTLEREWAV